MTPGTSPADAKRPDTLGRKLLRAFFGLLILLGGGVGIFSLFAQSRRYPLVPEGKARQIRGAYHVHTTASDGRGTLTDVTSAARSAGLGFVITTDHNLEVLPPPSYENGVLVIPGIELTTRTGHLVALGVSRALTRAERDGDPISIVRALGGFSILAHPVQTRNPWTDWQSAEEADGFELYSADTFFRRVLRRPLRLACAVGSYFAKPAHGLMVLADEDEDTNERYLSLSARSGKLALCAIDAHGIPPYEPGFRALATYLPFSVKQLPSDPIQAARQVLETLRTGQTYCGFSALGDASGFSIEGEPKVGKQLVVKLPDTFEAQVRLVVSRGGRLEGDGRTITLLSPGPLRLEAQLLSPGCTVFETWRPWIVPNPIRVGP